MNEEDFFGEKPKKTLSPEHKAKMAAGRARAREARSRGRPAYRLESLSLPRPALPQGVGDPALEDLERAVEAIERGDHRLSREPTNLAGKFNFPEQGKRPGWDYCWWPFKIMAEEVDASVLVEYARGGWIPVPRSHFPSLVPAGWDKPTIEREGCRAFMRPMRLTEEARAEAQKHAVEQRESRMRAALIGDQGRDLAARDPRATGVSVKHEPLM